MSGPKAPFQIKGRTVSTSSAPASDQVRLALPGEELTRRAITVITAVIVAMALAFSVVNVTSSLN
jgi:hypothetical protein